MTPSPPEAKQSVHSDSLSNPVDQLDLEDFLDDYKEE